MLDQEQHFLSLNAPCWLGASCSDSYKLDSTWRSGAGELSSLILVLLLLYFIYLFNLLEKVARLIK